ncbi:Carbohydrate esterase family 9 protein [Rhizoctonia solani]|uniref:Carbohydrate esterase family 9 protein n=1 Tax=Rhizoctonia solani TaxID=456999 RepID=A0A8H7LYA7_9AGAM|nr:Carbohydrate esterase family 9 protein [Rhizoctonia solani]
MKALHSLPAWSSHSLKLAAFGAVTLLVLELNPTYPLASSRLSVTGHAHIIPHNAQAILDNCAGLSSTPNHSGFEERLVSDRFDPESNGARPVLLQNATIWTGLKGADGRVQVTKGDLLLANGLIQAIFEGEMSTIDLIKRGFKNEGIELKNVQGAWITPAIFDLHSHVGDSSIPSFKGTGDDNSLKAPVQPFLRSIDGVNTHDEAFKLFRAGGVATSLVLPGSADNIGGQGFVIKLGKDAVKKGPVAMVLEPQEGYSPPITGARRIMHQGGDILSMRESLRSILPDTNGQHLEFSTSYNHAREVLNKQNRYCASAQTGRWGDIRGEDFPEDLEYESLVDALRGRAKAHVHCYEAVDLDGIVRLSNEFKLPIAAFHHAHEAYLVPDLIKQAYGKPPALAIFSSFARYKREAYRGSPYAPKILNENGLRVAMKSDGPPAINARYLFYEAAQAHYYGLPEDEAIASLTSTPAEIAGYSHRLGYIKQGYDADIVIWDSHPLSLGATPQQVYIDGSPQLDEPFVLGLPELLGSRNPDTIIFKNVGSFMRDKPQLLRRGDIIVASRGRVVCVGACTNYATYKAKVVDLQGGSIIPGLVSSGASIGLVEIDQEPSTNDGMYLTPWKGMFLPLLAAINSWSEESMDYLLQAGMHSRAISRREVALHVRLVRGQDSGYGISTKIATLRRLLLDAEEGSVYARVVKGELPLVILVENADIMTTLLDLKREIEDTSGSVIHLVFSGATEAHIIADKIAEANVGIILAPLRSIPYIWDQARYIPGPPLSRHTPLQILQEAGVTVGLGSPSIIVTQAWDVPQTRFNLGWAIADSNGTLSISGALALSTTNLKKLYRLPDLDTDLVAYRGRDALSYSSKPVAVMSTEREQNDLFE